jgi:hypothetical protein
MLTGSETTEVEGKAERLRGKAADPAPRTFGGPGRSSIPSIPRRSPMRRAALSRSGAVCQVIVPERLSL